MTIISTRHPALTATAAVALASGTALAGPVYYDFSGTIGGGGDDIVLASGAVIAYGNAFSGRIAYDPDAPLTPNSPTTGFALDFGWASVSIDSTAGMLVFSSTPDSATFAEVYNDHQFFGDNAFFNMQTLAYDTTATGTTDDLGMQISFQSRSNSVADSLEMPAELSLANYFASVSINGIGSQLDGNIDSIRLVPAPTALAALAGLGLIAPRRR